MNTVNPQEHTHHRRICILSSSFSGSTLLSIMLCQDPKYIGFGDTYLIPGINDESEICSCKASIVDCSYRKSVAGILQEHGISKGIIYDKKYAIPIRAIAKKFGGMRIVNFYHFLGKTLGYERVFSNFLKRERIYLKALLQPEGKRYYIDGSKNLVRAELLMHTDENTLLIHLVRDPLSVFHSAQNRHRRYEGGRTITGHAKSWMLYNKRASNLCKKYPDRSRSIVFDDLLANPTEVLTACAKSINIEFDASTLQEIDPTTCHVIGNRSRHAATSVKRAPTRPTESDLHKIGLTDELIEQVLESAKAMNVRYENDQTQL